MTDLTSGHYSGFVDSKDLLNTATLCALTAPAWLLPARTWPRLCRLVAALHVHLRRSRPDGIARAATLDRIKISAEELERALQAGIYQEILHTLREHRPGGWRPQIDVQGCENIDLALSKGRGAILWTSSWIFDELVVKKGLHQAGVHFIDLRSFPHPFSGTLYGKKILNPIQTRVEDRYLKDCVTILPDEEVAAVLKLRSLLRRNEVVAIAAVGYGNKPVHVPFLDGVLKLSRGAPILAGLSKAPLLPIFTLPTSSGGFEVTIEQPLTAQASDNPQRDAEILAGQYAALLETYVCRSATTWPGWYSPSRWDPRPK